jgi:O-antigen/teichoic acid export membrane protein
VTTGISMRRRVLMGAQSQVAANLVRVVVQLVGVAILAPTWGLQLFGEWLIMTALPSYLAFSDLGFFAAARFDMVMAVGRGDRELALGVFQAVSRGVTKVFAALVLLLPAIAVLTPLTTVLNLSTITEFEASWIFVVLGFDTLLISYATLLYGGFACEGRYGEAVMIMAAITLIEFVGLAAAALLGFGPAVAATAMLAGRAIGTAWMYRAMRRRAPWLKWGKPTGSPQVLKRLTSPALASAALPTGLAFNIQGTLVLVGIAAGPASAAVFSIYRTVSRVVIQLLDSISSVVAPEFAKAYGEGNIPLLRTIHRRGCQLAVWVSVPLLAFLAVFGPKLVEVWTQGTVHGEETLLYLFLAAAGIDALWYTSMAVLFSTNRHQRVTAIFVIACAVNLPLTYVFLEVWGLDGAGSAQVLLEVFMLFVVLRRSLPAAYDNFSSWLRAVLRPPVSLATLTSLRHRARAPG